MRVLIADDQIEVRWALRMLLQEESGLTLIGEVTKTEELLTRAQATQPDLILLDWELPGHPSSLLLTILHKLLSRPRVIALSGRPEAQRAALAAGVDAFVSKADPPERLLITLRTMSLNTNERGVQMLHQEKDRKVDHVAGAIKAAGATKAASATKAVQIDDRTLTHHVHQALHKIKQLRALHSPVKIDVNSGIVTLRGVVATYNLKALALQTVRDLLGVQEVRDELLTEPDLEIGIAQALAADPRTHEAAVNIFIYANNDNVVLAGRVSDPTVAQLAVSIATEVPGVRAVANHIQTIA